jgi:hypothetical protein
VSKRYVPFSECILRSSLLLIISIVLLIYAVIGNGRRHLLSILATLAIVWAIATSLFLYESEHPVALRETARWLVWSREYKHEVLAQPTSARGDLKHIEWDGWGYVPAGNTTVYLVFDPTDSALTATRNQPGKFNGIPCEVYQVRRMENHWYALLFYTDQTWDQSSCASALQE